MAEKITKEHLQGTHPAVADTIISMVLSFLPAVLQTVLADPARLKKVRSVLVTARDLLNQALPQ
jgi:hypothetical protein